MNSGQNFNSANNKKAPSLLFVSLSTTTSGLNLDMAVRKGVCLSGYACVINDGYFSHDRRKAALDRLISKYKNVKFLVGGLSADEKNKALKKTN